METVILRVRLVARLQKLILSKNWFAGKLRFWALFSAEMWLQLLGTLFCLETGLGKAVSYKSKTAQTRF
ncbi:hypothetical protein QJS10_CPA05g01401 [Acorus calamus]|uniref:Uncharacterized protein n=1 Tax=Acorus calamus TaxID=4465 RepID=A0AAV9EUH1_ACOCL|nr:hypothetical protein QJS10_CPA05g01401 [Acorus calamus]